jgi:hypothetical protein
MSSLRDRLQAIQQHSRGVPAANRPARKPADPPGWERTGEYTFRREELLDLSEEVRAGLREGTEFFLGRTPAEDLVFFDTETTGLSGGAGTVVFLIGCAGMYHGRFKLIQLFLSDFPGERDFLTAAAEILGGERTALSYNGRSFDTPLLRNRYIMNRMSFALPRQFDLLFPARRLWKNVLSDCSLATIEKEVLGRGRTGDLPGALVPQAYFEYLSSNRTENLLKVFSHNREDVVSLVFLFARLGKILRNPEKAGFVDPEGLGILLTEADPEKGLPYLRHAAENGGRRALERISRYYKGRKNLNDALSLWALWSGRSRYADLERAKYLEHILRDYPGALSVTESLLARVSNGKDKESLLRRKTRLEKKLRSLRSGVFPSGL